MVQIAEDRPTAWHRALADESRTRIVDELRREHDGLDAHELGRRLGLHPNTVRWHVGILADAGLVSARRAGRKSAGRPRTIYSLSPGSDVPEKDEFRLLASVLTSALAEEADASARSRAAGWKWGRYLAPRRSPMEQVDDEEAVGEIVNLLDEQGFAPERSDRKVTLRRCPFYDLAEQHPEVVCSVHRGLVEGALSELGSDLDVELTPFVEPNVCLVALTSRSALPSSPPLSIRTVLLPLTPDELLSTTRAVRRRLDLERPVEREVLEECLRLGQQAPVGSYNEIWHFVVVTDAEKRAALGELWRSFGQKYLGERPEPDPARGAHATRLLDSVWHLMDHIGDVPVHVIPCIEGRTDGKTAPVQASKFGTIVPAVWSFMLAARSRGLGTCWTTFHLAHEREAADLLGIPYDDVMQVALIPVAYTIGTDFRPARRKPLETMVHWDAW